MRKLTLHDYLKRLCDQSPPILKKTSRDLHVAAESLSLNIHSLSALILQDPLFVFKTLKESKVPTRGYDNISIDRLIMLNGLDGFMEKHLTSEILESKVSDHQVLHRILRLIIRAKKSSDLVFDWSLRLHDTHAEEVKVAALLRDITEILLYVEAPHVMMLIYQEQLKDKTLRSEDAQKMYLGFSVLDLHKALITQLKLPELLLDMMERDPQKQNPRARRVNAAVNFARHSANGWFDAALPDDYAEIAEIMHMSEHQVHKMLHVPKEAWSLEQQQQTQQ